MVLEAYDGISKKEIETYLLIRNVYWFIKIVRWTKNVIQFMVQNFAGWSFKPYEKW